MSEAMKYYPISEESARLSHMNMSMRDYEKNSATNGYMAQVDEVYRIADQIAETKPRQADRAYFLADKFARRLAKNVNEENRIGTMCPSVMIAGPAKFPVKKKEKQVAAWDRNHEDYKKVMQIKDKMLSILRGNEPILSGDEDAIERLEEKLEALTDTREMMKAVNAYYRKEKTLDGCPNLSEKQIEALKEAMAKPYHLADKPFAGYALTNNNANIRNTRQRLEELKKKKEQGTQESENKFFKVVENTENMRLQLFFDGKPDEETRTILKGNGFRWAPSNGCWQRQLTNNAKWSMDRVIKELEKLSEAGI